MSTNIIPETGVKASVFRRGSQPHALCLAAAFSLLGGTICLSPVSRVASADTALRAPLVAETPIPVPGAKGRFDLMEVDTSKNRLLVTHGSNSSLAVFNASTGAFIKEIATGGANGVAVDSKGGKYFVGAGEANLVAVIDSKTLLKTNEIHTTGPVDAMAFDTRRGILYAGHDDGTEVWVIDAKTEKILSSITIPEAPELVVYDPKTDRIYQNIKSDDTIQVIEPRTRSIQTHWATTPATKPHGMAIDFKTNHLFAAGANGKLVEIDVKTGAVIGQADIAPRVDEIAFDEATKRIYCASGTGVLSVVQETSMGLTALGDVTTAKGCHSVAVDPKTHAVWVAYGADESGYIMKLTVPKK